MVGAAFRKHTIVLTRETRGHGKTPREYVIEFSGTEQSEKEHQRTMQCGDSLPDHLDHGVCVSVGMLVNRFE